MNNYSKGATSPLTFPMTQVPAEKSGLVNPVVGSNYFDVPAPDMPGTDAFEAEANECLAVHTDMADNVWPGWFLETHGVSAQPSPILVAAGVSSSDPVTAADIVRMDKPIDLGMFCIDHLYANGYGIKKQYRREHSGQHIDFLGSYPALIADLSCNIDDALAEAFKVKYFYGRCRPEEYFDDPNFAVYPEGCPPHPEYVAGHGAVAGATYATLHEMLDLDEEGRLELETATKQFAMFRTLAGVHFQSANAEGWELGRKVASSCKLHRATLRLSRL